MSDANFIVISGTVVKLGDIVQAGNGKKRNVQIKSVREFQGRDGSVKSSQVFAEIDLWGDAVDKNIGLTPETKILVTGRLSYESWQTEDGTKKSKTVIRPDSIEVIGVGNAPQQSSYNPYPQQGQGFAPPQQPYGGSYQSYQQGYQQQAQAPQGGYYGQQPPPQNPYGPYATAPQQTPAPQPPPFQPQQPQQVVQPQQNAAPAPQQAQAPQGDDKPSDLPF